MTDRAFNCTQAHPTGLRSAGAILLALLAYNASAAVENKRALGNGVQLTCS